MAWNTKDYPDSLKNLEAAVRKKAIEIANSMLNEGYDEGRAIPIATSQAKKWYEDASEKEINHMIQASDQDLQATGESDGNGPKRMEEGQHVLPHENGWAIQTDNGEKPSEVFKLKEDAIKRAREIAKNKETHLIIHTQEGKVQEKLSYEID